MIQLSDGQGQMNATEVQTPFNRNDATASVPRATPWLRHPRIEWLLGSVVEAALLAAIALTVSIGAGIVGNPWYSFVRIEGGSMEPTIPRGDLIVVARAPAKVEPGMVLVLNVDDKVVTHRVVAVNADGTVVTRGDANGVNDTWGTQQLQVAGLFVATIPWLGHILPFGIASEASFADRVSATMQITVGSWPTPTPATPPECAGTAFGEVIVGTSGDDTIAAGNGGALVFGLGGNDTITGGNGKDCLVGGDGNDTLSGGNGKDVLLGGEGNDTLYGDGDGDVLEGGNGKDLLAGGDGIDACYGTSKDTFVGCETASTGGSANPVAAPASAPDAAPTSTQEALPVPIECAGLTFDEVIVGTAGDDTISAGNGPALVFGLGGNDTITGGDGTDCLVGVEGDDTLYGGNGEDFLLGGYGKDVLDGGDGIDACFGTIKDTFVDCEPTSTDGWAHPVEPPAPAPDAAPTPTPEASPWPTPALEPEATPTGEPTPAPTPVPTPQPPTVAFTFSVSGLTVSFTNQATGADTWIWDFGDGTTSTLANADHTYAVGGTYPVTLLAVDTDGTAASTSVDVTVAP
jgi:signal peptidase I